MCATQVMFFAIVCDISLYVVVFDKLLLLPTCMSVITDRLIILQFLLPVHVDLIVILLAHHVPCWCL